MNLLIHYETKIKSNLMFTLYFFNKKTKLKRNCIGSYVIGHGDAESCIKSLLDVFDGLDYVNGWSKCLLETA